MPEIAIERGSFIEGLSHAVVQPFLIRGRGLIPLGYRAYLLGTFASLDELSGVAPLEESAPEGTLMLMELQFAQSPSAESLSHLSSRLLEAGVPPWSGSNSLVQCDAAQRKVYIGWTKGIAWMPIIVGTLLLVVLPTLLGGLIWMALPESIKNTIYMMVMMLMMVGMMKFMSPELKERASE